jgi:hypothetical protein
MTLEPASQRAAAEGRRRVEKRRCGAAVVEERARREAALRLHRRNGSACAAMGISGFAWLVRSSEFATSNGCGEIFLASQAADGIEKGWAAFLSGFSSEEDECHVGLLPENGPDPVSYYFTGLEHLIVLFLKINRAKPVIM